MRELLAERGKRERLSEEKAELKARSLEQQRVSDELKAQLAQSGSKVQDMNNRFSVLTERCTQLESSLAAASAREDKNKMQYDKALKSAEEREAKLLAQIDKLADSIKAPVEGPQNL